MDKSLSNYELTESTLKIGTDSENGSGSDKSDPLELLNYVEGIESSSDEPVDEDFETKLPETVTILEDNDTGSKVYLIGTAHFSKESQEDVIKTIRNVCPEIIVVELCSSRTNILALDEATILEEAKNIDMQKIITTIKRNGVYNGLMYLLMLNMSAHITKEIGMAPGGEFRVAYDEAQKIPNCIVQLGDRSINITLQRALARLSWFQTIKLAWHLLTTKDPISVEEIEKCKNRDMLEQLLADLSGEYPAFREVFLDERDIYLTHSLQAAAKSKIKINGREAAPGVPLRPLHIVGVVGIGHVPGIIKLWPRKQEAYLKNIVTIPPASISSIMIRYSFKLSLLALGGYLVYKYVPVPKFLRENVHHAVQKVMTNIRSESGFRYTMN